MNTRPENPAARACRATSPTLPNGSGNVIASICMAGAYVHGLRHGRRRIVGRCRSTGRSWIDVPVWPIGGVAR
ncbi:hypothetical protein I547_4506 [Mycobacterium kansasii 824]|nr:hypothetical protein I547_4506 [Mycobacterium kansasii 824]